uniref:Dirigent protein n=1 Tax=Syphacia muris TaxID=451379 RepID=A0A0N5AM24_9BILA
MFESKNANLDVLLCDGKDVGAVVWFMKGFVYGKLVIKTVNRLDGEVAKQTMFAVHSFVFTSMAPIQVRPEL